MVRIIWSHCKNKYFESFLLINEWKRRFLVPTIFRSKIFIVLVFNDLQWLISYHLWAFTVKSSKVKRLIGTYLEKCWSTTLRSSKFTEIEQIWVCKPVMATISWRALKNTYPKLSNSQRYKANNSDSDLSYKRKLSKSKWTILQVESDACNRHDIIIY